MKKILILAVLLSGCASNGEYYNKALFEDQTNITFNYNTSYCNGDGFKSFSELRTYVNFICSDGKRFMLRKSTE